MWKRDEAVRPSASSGPSGASPAPAAPDMEAIGAKLSPPRGSERDMVNIGKSVVIKGELTGSEDLMIEGQVEGKIELRQNVLTIGPNGKIKAHVFAKAVVIQGEVHGNISATERVDIRDNGSVDGDISAPRVAIADGAHFRGSIDMQRLGSDARPAAAVSTSKPAADLVKAAVTGVPVAPLHAAVGAAAGPPR